MASKVIKTHIRREPWMTDSRYNMETVCTTLYASKIQFADALEATCESCLRIWLWEMWKAGKLTVKDR